MFESPTKSGGFGASCEREVSKTLVQHPFPGGRDSKRCIGKVPGLLAVCIYALPPIVRLTNLGIREVDKETLEASEAFGATPMQKLRSVQIPLSLPTIFAGINQTIMMALAMVVIASMIGVKGLGVPILQAISNQYLALGMMNGLAIVALAIIFDRVTQQYGQRIQKHRGQLKK